MTEQMQRAETENKARRRMLITLVLLLVTLAIVLVRDRAIWFGSDEPLDANEISTPAAVPNSAAQAPATNNVAAASAPTGVVPAASANNSAPAPKTKNEVPANTKNEVAASTKNEVAASTKNEVAAKGSSEPAVAGSAVVSGTRTELPPMEVEVVAGDTHRTVHPGSNAVKVELPPNSGSGAMTAFKWSPVTNAAERDRLSTNTLESLPQPVEASYPSLARQMNVQGSVLIQAFVGADGGIRDLRVLSGPAILVSAALEAARQWRFKPYIQNGQPVETQAKITVNFNIKVL